MRFCVAFHSEGGSLLRFRRNIFHRNRSDTMPVSILTTRDSCARARCSPDQLSQQARDRGDQARCKDDKGDGKRQGDLLRSQSEKGEIVQEEHSRFNLS